MAARRRREPMGWRPWVRARIRSSRRVETVFGSSIGGGGGDEDEDMGSMAASSCFEADVLKLRLEGKGIKLDDGPLRRHRNAGRTV